MSQFTPVSYEGDANLEYATYQARVGRKKIRLDNAAIDSLIEIGGNIIWVSDASDLDAEITFKYNREENQNNSRQPD